MKAAKKGVFLMVVPWYFYWFVIIDIFQNQGYFSPKMGGGKNCQKPFPAILRLKQ